MFGNLANFDDCVGVNVVGDALVGVYAKIRAAGRWARLFRPMG
jgi:hypothetical protein